MNIKKTDDQKIFESLEKMTNSLEELVKWTKATTIPKVRDILEELVASPRQKILYKFSDGRTGRKELSEVCGIDEADISRDWKKWARGGILEQVPSKGGSRGRSLFELEDFGIEVPELPKPKNSVIGDNEKNLKITKSQVKRNEQPTV